MTGVKGRNDAAELFAGEGEMRALCRDLDWASTPLGPVEGWSVSLRTIASTVLASRNPMFLFWGPEHVQIYNDAYRPSLGWGGRHPRALGVRGREFWTDIWETIGPQIEQVMSGYDELLREGRVNELTHQVNSMRRDTGLEVTDRNVLTIAESDGDLLPEYEERIKGETLAVEIRVGADLAIELAA